MSVSLLGSVVHEEVVHGIHILKGEKSTNHSEHVVNMNIDVNDTIEFNTYCDYFKKNRNNWADAFTTTPSIPKLLTLQQDAQTAKDDNLKNLWDKISASPQWKRFKEMESIIKKYPIQVPPKAN